MIADSRGYRRWGRYSAALIAVIFVSPAFHPRKARGADDPDMQAVQAVCGRCHTTAVFLKEFRTWNRWNDVFADMTQRGVEGTDEQLARVATFFLENLTLVNINTSPDEELTGVLGVSDEVAASIIERRQRRPFANIAELKMVPGVDAAKVEQRKSRILF